MNIHSVAKYQKMMGTFWSNKKISEKHETTVPKKEGKSHCVKKWGIGDPFVLEWLVRGFGCVENEVLSTYGKSA